MEPQPLPFEDTGAFRQLQPGLGESDLVWFTEEAPDSRRVRLFMQRAGEAGPSRTVAFDVAEGLKQLFVDALKVEMALTGGSAFYPLRQLWVKLGNFWSEGRTAIIFAQRVSGTETRYLYDGKTLLQWRWADSREADYEFARDAGELARMHALLEHARLGVNMSGLI
jgi:hypothetical protein